MISGYDVYVPLSQTVPWAVSSVWGVMSVWSVEQSCTFSTVSASFPAQVDLKLMSSSCSATTKVRHIRNSVYHNTWNIVHRNWFVLTYWNIFSFVSPLRGRGVDRLGSMYLEKDSAAVQEGRRDTYPSGLAPSKCQRWPLPTHGRG